MSNSASNSLQLYRRVPKNEEDDSYHLHHLAEDERLFCKPTLVCLGGAKISQSQPVDLYKRAVAGLLKLGHALIGYENYTKKDDPLDIVAAVYPEDSHSLIAQRITHNLQKLGPEAEKTILSDSAADFVKTHIYPLVQTEEGHVRPIEEIKSHFRNIHFLAHSFGAAFVQMVGDRTHDYLKEMKLDEKQIKDITSQVLVVSGGATVLPGSGKASFTTMNIINRSDRKISYEGCGIGFPDIFDNLLKAAGRYDPIRDLPSLPLTIMPLRFERNDGKGQLLPDSTSNEYVMYAAQEHIYRPDLPFLKEKAIDPYMERSNGRGHFGFPHTGDKDGYHHGDQNGHEVISHFHFGAGRHGSMLRLSTSSMLANGLNNAIANHRRSNGAFMALPSVPDLLKSPRTMAYPVKEDVDFAAITYDRHANRSVYNERIEKALSGKVPGRSV